MKFSFVFAGLMIACSGACTDESPPPDPRPLILKNQVESVILPGHAALATEAEALAAAAEAFCASPGDLGPVQTAWDKARGAWKRVEIFAFGPQVAYPERLGAAIDFWPVRPDKIQALLDGTAPLDAAAIAQRGAAEKGLPVIEFLLFGPEAGPGFGNPRRCLYLRAATQDFAKTTAALRDAWAPEKGGYAKELTAPGNEFPGPQEALSEVVNRMWFAIENIRKDKLGGPLGTATTTPRPDKAESQFAGRSLADIRDVVASIEALFATLTTHPALKDHPERIAAFRQAMDQAQAALAAVPEPLTRAIFDNPVAVVAASDALKGVQRVIQADVIGAMGLNVAFNDNDGD